MQRVPGCTHLMAGEGILGVRSFRNDCAIELFDGDPPWREHRLLIWSSVRKDRRALLMQPHGHPPGVGILNDALEREEAAPADDRGLDLFVVIPAIDAAMCVQDLTEQFVHLDSPYAGCFKAASTGNLRERLRHGKGVSALFSETQASRARRLAG